QGAEVGLESRRLGSRGERLGRPPELDPRHRASRGDRHPDRGARAVVPVATSRPGVLRAGAAEGLTRKERYSKKKGVAMSSGDSHEPIHVGQMKIRYLVDGTATGGLGVFELNVPPKSNVPPPHSHTKNEECVYVLEGVLRYAVDDTQR